MNNKENKNNPDLEADSTATSCSPSLFKLQVDDIHHFSDGLSLKRDKQIPTLSIMLLDPLFLGRQWHKAPPEGSVSSYTKSDFFVH